MIHPSTFILLPGVQRIYFEFAF